MFFMKWKIMLLTKQNRNWSQFHPNFLNFLMICIIHCFIDTQFWLNTVQFLLNIFFKFIDDDIASRCHWDCIWYCAVSWNLWYLRHRETINCPSKPLWIGGEKKIIYWKSSASYNIRVSQNGRLLPFGSNSVKFNLSNNIFI